MGYKDVCFQCRKAFNRGNSNFDNVLEKCPECGSKTAKLNHKFKPPKKSETRKWEVVKFIVDRGFSYDKLIEEIKPGVFKQLGKYPESMREAREFVKNFYPNGIKIK